MQLTMTHTRILCSLVCLLCLQGSLLWAQQAPAGPAQTQPKFPDGKQFAGSELTYKIIDAAGNTYGYDIYSNNKLTIHQPSVPGLPGNSGFKTKQGAESVAKLVVKKIKNGEMPPTVTIEEMKKLKAID